MDAPFCGLTPNFGDCEEVVHVNMHPTDRATIRRWERAGPAAPFGVRATLLGAARRLARRGPLGYPIEWYARLHRAFDLCAEKSAMQSRGPFMG